MTIVRRSKIVVADDNPEWLSLAALALRQRRYRVFPARSGSEAIHQIQRHRPDCAVLDFNLTDKTAIEVGRSIKANPELRRIPLVVLTAHSEEKLRCYRDAEADHFVAKDGRLDELVAVVDSVLRRVAWDRGEITLGDVTLDPRSLSVVHGRSTVKLSPEQFSFFQLLVQRSPHHVPNEDIYRLILHQHRHLGDDTDAVRSLAHRTRQALGLPLRDRIKSIAGLGWVYIV